MAAKPLPCAKHLRNGQPIGKIGSIRAFRLFSQCFESGLEWHLHIAGWAITRRRVPEGHRITRTAFPLSTGENPRRVTVKQKYRRHDRAVGLRTSTRVGIFQRAKIALNDILNQKPFRVALRKPVFHYDVNKTASSDHIE